MNELTPRLFPPGTQGIGPESPVQQALDWVQRLFESDPSPDLGSEAAKSSGILLATHLLHLIRGAGQLNGEGLHSAAVSLFRPLEDALDCFAAVTQVAGAAERWQVDELKASEAAKLWTAAAEGFRAPRGPSLAEYRKLLRDDFNALSHCAYQLCLWNLYFDPKVRVASSTAVTGTMEPNMRPMMIESNGHTIDAYLTAHLLEFLAVVSRAYSSARESFETNAGELQILVDGIVTIMERHDRHRCQDVHTPPELRRLKPDSSPS